MYTDIKEFTLTIFDIYNAFINNKMYMYHTDKKLYNRGDKSILYQTPDDNGRYITLFSMNQNDSTKYRHVESEIDTLIYRFVRFDKFDQTVIITDEYVEREIILNDYPNLLNEETFFQQQLVMNKLEFDVVYMYQYFKSADLCNFYFDLDYYEECKKALKHIQ